MTGVAGPAFVPSILRLCTLMSPTDISRRETFQCKVLLLRECQPRRERRGIFRDVHIASTHSPLMPKPEPEAYSRSC